MDKCRACAGLDSRATDQKSHLDKADEDWTTCWPWALDQGACTTMMSSLDPTPVGHLEAVDYTLVRASAALHGKGEVRTFDGRTAAKDAARSQESGNEEGSSNGRRLRGGRVRIQNRGAPFIIEPVQADRPSDRERRRLSCRHPGE